MVAYTISREQFSEIQWYVSDFAYKLAFSRSVLSCVMVMGVFIVHVLIVRQKGNVIVYSFVYLRIEDPGCYYVVYAWKWELLANRVCSCPTLSTRCADLLYACN